VASLHPCSAVSSAPQSTGFRVIIQVKPYLEGSGASLLSSKGSRTTLASGRVRQKVTHGLDLNVNYTYAKALGNSSNQASGSTAT